MPTATLRLRITSTWTGGDESSFRRVRGGMAEASVNVGRVGSMFRNSVGGLLRLRTIAVVFAPSLFTLGKAALTLAAAAVTMGVAAGAAAAPWVGLAVTAARNSEKMGVAGARFERGAQGVKNAWMDLAKRTASLTLGPVTDVLDGMASAIPKLEPLVRDVAPIFAQVGRDIRRWFEGGDFDRLINNLRIAGVPAFRSLATAGRDFVATVGIGFRAFLPMAQRMAEDIEGALAPVRRAASSGSFDRFIQNFRDDWPEVSRFLREGGEAIGTMAELLNGAGEGQLGALSTMLDLLNRIDPRQLTLSILSLGAMLLGGRGLFLLLTFIAFMRSGWSEVSAAAALSGSAASLSGASVSLLAMAASIRRLARSLAITIVADALRRVADIWESIPKSGSTTVSLPTLGLVSVRLMGVGSTWATVRSLGTITFSGARVDRGVFTVVVAAVTLAWAVVRVAAAIPAIFRAMAVSNVEMVAATVILAWTQVRVMAAAPVIFRAAAVPGNVSVVAGIVIAAWAAVRILSLVPVLFRAAASGGSAVSGANAARSAWQRVLSMPRSWSATARVNPGPAVAGSSRTVAAWRALYGLPRFWSASASISVRGGFGGLGGGGSTTVYEGGGGGQNYFLTFPAATFGPGLFPNVPDFADPSLGTDENWYVENPGDFTDGGSIAPPLPGDFGDFATGGQIGGPESTRRRVRTGPRRDGERHIHIYEDVWVGGSKEELVELFTDILERAN